MKPPAPCAAVAALLALVLATLPGFVAAAPAVVEGALMDSPRAGHQATLLADGQVLVTGGAVRTNEPTAVVEQFDPGRAQLAATGALLQPRAHHAAVRLRDGRVLVVGGLVGRRTATASAEIYDPRSGRFSATSPLAEPRCKAAALLLADGRVMVLAGSRDCDDRQRLATTEMFDPATKRFEPGPRLVDARYKIASAAVRLDGGEVLIAGGASDVEVWRPGTPAFVRAAPALGVGLAFSTATVLGGERVLVIGGNDAAIVPTARSWQVSTLAGLRR